MNRFRSSLLSALFSVALAACSAAKFAEVANLNDPRTVVDESVDGATLTLQKGSALVVRLPVQTGDGNRWELAPLATAPLASPILIDYMPANGFGALPTMGPYSAPLARWNPPGRTAAPPAADGSKPGQLVTAGDAVLRLRGVAEGKATVQLDYRNADVPGSPASRSVRFDVAVVP